MEIQEIAGADFIFFKGGKDSIALEETYPWYCSFMADFYNDFFNNCFYFPRGKSYTWENCLWRHYFFITCGHIFWIEV